MPKNQPNLVVCLDYGLAWLVARKVGIYPTIVQVTAA